MPSHAVGLSQVRNPTGNLRAPVEIIARAARHLRDAVRLEAEVGLFRDRAPGFTLGLAVIDIQPGGSDVAGFQSCLMAKKPTEGRRKLVEFDAPTWHALNLLSRESMKSFQHCKRHPLDNLYKAAAALVDELRQ
jgi:hypothetical protein